MADRWQFSLTTSYVSTYQLTPISAKNLNGRIFRLFDGVSYIKFSSSCAPTDKVLNEKHSLFKKRYEVISRPAMLPKKCRYDKRINTVFIYSNK